MERRAESHLRRWLEGEPRKPLVVRGARQVGKTTLVRQFAAATDRVLLEVDLERHPELDRIFRDFDPDRMVSALEARTDRKLHRAILFLDEIQAATFGQTLRRYRATVFHDLHRVHEKIFSDSKSACRWCDDGVDAAIRSLGGPAR